VPDSRSALTTTKVQREQPTCQYQPWKRAHGSLQLAVRQRTGSRSTPCLCNDCYLHVFNFDGGWRIGRLHSKRICGHDFSNELAFDRRPGVSGRVHLQRGGRNPDSCSPTMCPASEFGSTLIKVPAPGRKTTITIRSASRRAACSMLSWRRQSVQGRSL